MAEPVGMKSPYEELIERLRVCAEQSEMGRNFASTPQSCRAAAEALSLLTRQVSAKDEALNEAETMLIRARDKRKLFGLQHAIESVQSALQYKGGGE